MSLHHGTFFSVTHKHWVLCLHLAPHLPGSYYSHKSTVLVHVWLVQCANEGCLPFFVHVAKIH